MFKVYNIKNETLWNNSNITYGNHTLFFKAWEKVGICKVHHVLDHGYWRNAAGDICQIYGLPELYSHSNLHC